MNQMMKQMSESRMRFLATVLGLATVLAAQRAGAQEAEPPAPQPPVAAPAPATTLQYMMRDGSYIIGMPTAEDETTITIETAVGTVRVYKANIAAVQPAGQPAAPAPAPYAPAPAPPPMPAPVAPAPPQYAAPGYPYYGYPVAPPVAEPARPRRGLIIGGSILFGVTWGLTAFASLIGSSLCEGLCTNDPIVGAVPVLGPLLLLGQIGGDSGTVLVLDALAQGAGLAMLIVGIATSRGSRPQPQRFAVAPMLTTTGGGGLMVAGRF